MYFKSIIVLLLRCPRTRQTRRTPLVATVTRLVLSSFTGDALGSRRCDLVSRLFSSPRYRRDTNAFSACFRRTDVGKRAVTPCRKSPVFRLKSVRRKRISQKTHSALSLKNVMVKQVQ